MTKTYTVTVKVWLYPGNGGWHFVSIPPDTTQDIDFYFSHAKKGWGSLPVTVTVGSTTWTTSIFADKKTATYLLPVKADVRKAEGITAGDDISLTMELHG
jgi:hypothetical protein